MIIKSDYNISYKTKLKDVINKTVILVVERKWFKGNIRLANKK